MAEKIIDIKLNAKEAIQQIQTLDESIVQLEDNVSDATRELNKMEAELAQVTGASGKDLARRKQLNERIAKTKAFLKQENTALKENKKQKQRLTKQNSLYNKKLKEQAKAHNEVSKGLTKTIGGTGVLDRATGGLFSRYQGLAQGLKATTSGLGKFKLALIGTGVGALVVVLGSLVAAFQASEEGQNRFTKALNQGKAIIANAVELLSQLGNGITNTFAAIGNFITGKGSLSDVGDALGDTFDTVSEKISTFSEDIKEDVKLAGELSDQLAKADKIDRKLMVERQKANAKVNELRTKAYNTEKFTAEERIKFLEEAITIEDGITNKEIEAARLRFEAKKKENDMTSLARKEDLDEQAALEKKLFELEAKKINRQREVENQRQMLVRKQKQEEEKRIADELKREQDRLDSIDEIRDEYTQRELEKQAQTELQKVELEELNKIAELEALNASEEAKQQVIDYYYSLKDDARKADEEKAAEQRQREKEEELALAQAKASINMMAADNVGKAFALIGKMAGKNRALQAAAIIGENAAGIAKQIISTKAANAAVTLKYAALPGGVALAAAEKTMNNVSLGLGIAGSMAATQKALASLKSGGSASAPSVRGGRGEGGQAPAFNVVGAAPENQLAQAIGQQDAQPVKAYVVSNEITNAQSLERNIINESTIG
jgi:chromosome segregation ATPase